MNILQYIAIISNILTSGGIWINVGPLHFHMGSVTALPYSASQLNEVIKNVGFDLLEQTTVESNYCGEDHISMKPEHYIVPLTVWRLARKDEILPLEMFCNDSSNEIDCDRKANDPPMNLIPECNPFRQQMDGDSPPSCLNALTQSDKMLGYRRLCLRVAKSYNYVDVMDSFLEVEFLPYNTMVPRLELIFISKSSNEHL
eukprot:gene1435-2761_t